MEHKPLKTEDTKHTMLLYGINKNIITLFNVHSFYTLYYHTALFLGVHTFFSTSYNLPSIKTLSALLLHIHILTKFYWLVILSFNMWTGRLATQHLASDDRCLTEQVATHNLQINLMPSYRGGYLDLVFSFIPISVVTVDQDLHHPVLPISFGVINYAKNYLFFFSFF